MRESGGDTGERFLEVMLVLGDISNISASLSIGLEASAAGIP